MKYDGERLIPGLPGLQRLNLEHMARYEFAEQFVGDKVVVDCGCGVGYGSALLARTAKSVIGFDYSDEAIEHAKSIYGVSEGISFATRNLEEADFEVPRCDVAVLFEVIEHLVSPGQFVAKVAGALNPGGVFILSTPNFMRHSRGSELDNEHHYHDFREEDLVAILSSHFEHVQIFSQSVLIASAIGLEARPASIDDLSAEDHMFFVAVASHDPINSVSSWIRVESDRITSLLSLRLREERTARENLKTRSLELTSEVARSSRQVAELERTLAELERTLAELERTRLELQQQSDSDRKVLEQALGVASELHSQMSMDEKRIAKLESREKDLKRDVAVARKKYDRLRNRRSVRLALVLAQRLRFLRHIPGSRRLYRSISKLPPRPRATRLPRVANRSEIISAVTNLRPPRPRVDHGLVSIVVPTRDGIHHLKRLVAGLHNRTDYPSFELVLVDNASSDGTIEWASQLEGFPVTVIRNERNESFSRACNQGAAAAAGDYLLFLNNDVDPINPGWLTEMVAVARERGDAGAVGALLIYPESLPGERGELQLSVQHRGIGYTWHNGRPRAINLGRGESPVGEVLAATYPVASVTAACMLVPRVVFDEVGKFHEDYVYGTEDVDLNLSIRQSGRTIYFCGQAALFHHESASQDELGLGVLRVNRVTNAQVFSDRWAPALARTLRLDGIAETTVWADRLTRKRRVAITLTRDDSSFGWGDWYTAHELGDAFVSDGWDVIYAEKFQDNWYNIPDDVGLVISLLDDYDVRKAPASSVTVAWIRNWTDRWLEQSWVDSFDVLIPSSLKSAELIEQRLGRTSTVMPLASNPNRFHPGPIDPTYESDYVFTGNFWGQGRDVVDRLIVNSDERFLIFGKNWDKVPRVQRFWRGFLDYDALPGVYRSAPITIDDTAGPTLPYGAVNSRVFDALASGSLVLSDNTLGSDEVFGGLLPTYSSRDDLRSLMDRYLQDEPARLDLVGRLRSMVLESHTYQHRVSDIVSIVDTELRYPRVAVKIGAPNWEVAESWGDTHFARHFTAALRRLKFRTSIQVLSEWDAEGYQDADIVVHLRGLTPYVPKPSQVNVLWIISHPGDISPREVERYDLVLVASSRFAEYLNELVDVPVRVFYQATDPGHFYPRPPSEELRSEVLFVGNSRKSERPAVAYLQELGIEFDLYGNDWDGLVPSRHLRGFMPNEQLPDLYGSCSILVNDHWPDMRDWGFLSNRLFDALATGTFVLSDRAEGITDTFGGAIPTFDSADSLGELIAHYRTNPDARQSLAAQGMAVVRSQHTFDARAKDFADLVAPFMEHHRFLV